MGIGAYIGISSRAKKIKSCYVGITSAARKVKAIYAGINGVVKKVWGSSGTLRPISSEITGITGEKFNVSAAAIGDYAIFVGGEGANQHYSSRVDAYNSMFVRQQLESLIHGKTYIAGASNGKFAIFCGGASSYDSETGEYTGDLYGYAYNENLVRNANLALITEQECSPFSANFKPYAIFSDHVYKIEYYDQNLVKQSVATAYSVRGLAALPSKYILSQAYKQNSQCNIEVYNAQFVKIETITKQILTLNWAKANIGNDYVVLAGGWSGRQGDYGQSPFVEIFDSNLIYKNTLLTKGRENLASGNTENYAIFAGGSQRSFTTIEREYDTVDAIDNNLVVTKQQALKVPRGKLAGVSWKNKVLFAGGSNHSQATRYNTVDGYEEIF